jgi:hypothetical protein
MNGFLQTVRLFALAALLATANRVPAHAQQALPRTVNPATYKSPSGNNTLTVDPSDIYGRYGGTYRVAKNGKELWAKPLKFTLCEAAITDTGVVAGYAYTLGEHGFGKNPDEPRPGDMVVAIIDPTGKLRLQQITKRQPAGILHSPPFPVANGLIVDEPNDRLIVRLYDFGPTEIWWTYRLSNGAVLEKRTPQRWVADWQHLIRIIDAKLIRGTPVILVQWMRTDMNHRPDVVFLGVDPEAKPLFSLEVPDDYAVEGDEKALDKLRQLQQWTRAHGRILETDRPKQFEIVVAADSTRVTFSVDQNAQGVWKAKELATVPFSLPPTEPAHAATMNRVTNGRTLKDLGRLALQTTSSSADAVVRDGRGANPSSAWLRRIAGISVDVRGRIYAVDSKIGTVHVFDPAGKLLHVCLGRPADFNLKLWSQAIATNDKGDVYLGLEEPDFPDDKRSYAHFTSDGKRLKNVVLPAARCFLQPGGDLIVAMRYDDVRLIDPSGKTVRTINRRPDNNWLERPQAIALAPDGSIAILARRSTGSETSANLYKANGDPLRTIPLPESVDGLARIAYDGRRLIVAGDDLLIFDAAGRLLLCCEPPLKVPQGMYYYPYILPGGRVLTLYDGKEPVLHRYELP